MTAKIPDGLGLNPQLMQITSVRITPIAEKDANDGFLTFMLDPNRSWPAPGGSGAEKAKEDKRASFSALNLIAPVFSLQPFYGAISASPNPALAAVRTEGRDSSTRSDGFHAIPNPIPAIGRDTGVASLVSPPTGSRTAIVAQPINFGSFDGDVADPIAVKETDEKASSSPSFVEAAPLNGPRSIPIASFETHLPAAILQTIADPTTSSELAARSTRSLDDTQNAAAPVKVIAIQIEPDHLGALEIRIRISDKRLKIEIDTETREVVATLDRGKDRLLEVLQTEGYDIENIELRMIAPTADGSGSNDMTRENAFSSEQSRGEHYRSRRSRQASLRNEDSSDTESGSTVSDHRSSGGVYL